MKSPAPRHVILITNDLDTCLDLASCYRRSSVLITHSRNFIVEKLINCCVFHNSFFTNAAKTERNVGRICIALGGRSFFITSKVFCALIISFSWCVFCVLKILETIFVVFYLCRFNVIKEQCFISFKTYYDNLSFFASFMFKC